ncbi:MAG: aminotransferase [Planctomycetota bacterium]
MTYFTPPPYLDYFMDKYFHAECDLASSGRAERSWEELRPFVEGRKLFDNKLKSSDRHFTEVFKARYPLDDSFDLMCVPSTTSANFVAMNALVPPRGKIAIENPVYDPIPYVAMACDREVLSFQRDPDRDFRPCLASLDEALSKGAKLAVLSNLHNPSGASLCPEDLIAIGALLEKHDALCLVDEVYLEFLPDWRERTALRYGKRFIVSASLTKVYGLSELACGWLAGPVEHIYKCRRYFSLFSYHNSSPGIEMACILSENFERFFESDRLLIESNRRKLKQWLELNSIHAFMYKDSPIVLVKLPGTDDDRAFCEAAFKNHKLFLTPSSFFGINGWIRIGLFKSPELFEKGLSLLKAAIG